MKTFNEVLSLDVYLKEISKVPLMTPQDENATATKMGELRDEIEKLDKKIDKEKAKGKASAGQEEVAEKRADLEKKMNYYKDKMIRSNCRLVVSIARRYQNHHLHLSDLIEEGNIGLMKAVERFDPARGFRFSTFAIWWIKQSVIKALKEKGNMIRIPMHISKEFSRYSRSIQEYRNSHGKEPMMEDIRSDTHLDSARIDLLSKIPRDFVSTHMRLGNSDKEIGEILVDETPTFRPTEEAVKKDLEEALDKIMHKLSTKEYEILQMRYGLYDKEPLVLDVIGKRLGITRERVRQIQASALKKMRKMGLQSELNLFLE